MTTQLTANPPVDDILGVVKLYIECNGFNWYVLVLYKMHTLLIITPQCNSLHIIIGIVKLYIRCTIVIDLSAAPWHTAKHCCMSTDNVSGLLTDGHAAKRRRMSTDPTDGHTAKHCHMSTDSVSGLLTDGHTAKHHRMSTDLTNGGHTAKNCHMSTDSVSGLLTNGHTAKCHHMSTDSVSGGLLTDLSAALGSATSGEQCSGS
jgi:hypothetical protein